MSINLGYSMGGSAAAVLCIEEDDTDISSLTDVSSVKFTENSRKISSIKKRGLFEKSFDGEELSFGDYIDLPSLRVEVAPLENADMNAKGYKSSSDGGEYGA